MTVDLRLGDCLDILPTMEEDSIDTAILDPPGGIAFMGKKWDNKTGYIPCTTKGKHALELASLLGLEPWEAGFLAFMSDAMQATFRVLKPGAMALVWGIPRTSDLTSLALRVAGFEVREKILHLFGSGFPKSHNISKAIDRKLGAEREVVGQKRNDYRKGWVAPEVQRESGYRPDYKGSAPEFLDITAPATPSAQLWDGWGTALKPAVEEWILAMKPRDGTFANNALVHGVAGLNIDGTRVRHDEAIKPMAAQNGGNKVYGQAGRYEPTTELKPNGRWPANLLLSHSPGCRRVGVRKVKGSNGVRGASTHIYGGGKGLTEATGQEVGYASPDGTETIPDWVCTADCAVRLVGESSGERAVSGTAKLGKPNTSRPDSATVYGKYEPHTSILPNDKGTAARFFQQFDGEWECTDDCAVRMLGESSGESTSGPRYQKRTANSSEMFWKGKSNTGVRDFGDKGTAARYFQRFTYQPKASRRSRELGLLGHIPCVKCGQLDSVTHVNPKTGKDEKCHRNGHPTVKSLDLMRWLCRLTRTPTGGTIIDPFAGSGRTGIAAVLEGRSFVGIEQEQASFDIAEAGIRWAQEQAAEMVQPQLAMEPDQ